MFLLCGSPNAEDGNSLYMLNALKQAASSDAPVYSAIKSPDISQEAFVRAVESGEPTVLSFPLYADSLPAYFLRFLTRLEKVCAGLNTSRAGRIYVIVNNGFYDAAQNDIAIEIIKRWCERCSLTYGRALAVGAGGMVKAAPIGKGPMAGLEKELLALADDIQSGKSGETAYVETAMPRWIYRIAGNMSFNIEAKKNGLRKRDLLKR